MPLNVLLFCFSELLKDDPMLKVPAVIPELSSKQVLTTEYIEGVPLDKAEGLSQETRNEVGVTFFFFFFFFRGSYYLNTNAPKQSGTSQNYA